MTQVANNKNEVSTSSLRRNQTNSVYDILPSFCALPRVTAPQKIRSIMRVLKAETKKIRICFLQSWIPTVVVVPGEILPVDEQVVILVELPELAVDDVEVLVAEEVRHLVQQTLETLLTKRYKDTLICPLLNC